MFEDLEEKDNHMSLSENEDQNSDASERKSNDENEKGDDDEETRRKVVPKGTTKRIIRNPQPKLNAQRLIGPKGIHTIENYFESFKFYGKGHEKKDLDRIMKRLEHWAHRLFPKYQFDDFLEKAETVGSKKELSTFLKKYRRDMDLGDGSTAANDDDDDNVERGNSPEPMDEFDMLIAEQIEKSKQATNSRAQAVQRHNDEIFNNLVNSSSQSLNQTISGSQAASAEKINNQENTSCTASSSNEINKTNVEESEEEIKKRIERNRQMAIERRLARLKRDEENKRKKEAESQVNVESSQIPTDELLQTQSQSANVRNEIQVTVTIEHNSNSMLVDNFNTQSIEDKQETDKNIDNENSNSMVVDVSKEFIDNIPITQSRNVQNMSSIDENNVDNQEDFQIDRNQAVTVEKVHKNENNPKLLTDEELDKEIDDAVNQFIMQKRRLMK
ncbi:protein TIPIN homolog [Chelonus insularis]|uniref:protein TIPIN homolog n=1 Tax=Chelonus insularis TaxID=460826 RepID=UPI001588C6ED|nr:protein TIPIN homolog [Chelonus insularis]